MSKVIRIRYEKDVLKPFEPNLEEGEDEGLRRLDETS